MMVPVVRWRCIEVDGKVGVGVDVGGIAEIGLGSAVEAGVGAELGMGVDVASGTQEAAVISNRTTSKVAD
ncbi:MAG: hypothetical protein WB588_08760 [Dehalococcoidia bacterium]